MPNSSFFVTAGFPPLDDIAQCDVGCIQRMMLEGNLEYMSIARKHGIRLIYDLDDNVWNLPALNPAKQAFRDHIGGLEACIEWADVITTSTDQLRKQSSHELSHLRNAASKNPIPIMVIENYIDLKLFKPTPLARPNDNIVIGWGGSNTHLGDIAEVWHMLPSIVEKYPNVEMEFVGMWPPAGLVGHPRCKVHPWSHVSEFHNRVATWDWDIFLAPLDINKFNKSKSNIKMQEAAAVGSPCLATDIVNYRSFCEKIPELEWLLCFTTTQWEKKLCELIENTQLRKELGLAMRKNVEDNYDVAKQVWRWDEAIDLALSQ
jgi:glycosyltransferase involved in cell wall biosynthesis